MSPSQTLTQKYFGREGFTLDTIFSLAQKTVLNPTITLPLFLWTKYTYNGQGFALDNPVAVKRLRLLLWLGAARVANAMFNRGALDNWTGDNYVWSQELVVITGGSGGIGQELVKRFALKGVRTIIMDVAEPAWKLQNSVKFVKCDLSSNEDIIRAANEVKSKHGNPTILLNNAGFTNRHTILDTPDGLLDKIFAVNTLSHYRMTKQFLPHMITRNHGMIVTTASLAGYITPSGMVDYSATKAAAVAFHEGLTSELSHRYNAPKVRTVCVCPNFVATKLADGFVNESTFANPTLHPESIADAMFAKILTGTSGFVVLPRSMEYIAMNIRSFPWWFQKGLQKSTAVIMRGVEKAEIERVKKLAVEAKDKVVQGASEAKEKVVQTASEVKETTSRKFEDVKTEVKRTVNDLEQSAVDVKNDLYA